MKKIFTTIVTAVLFVNFAAANEEEIKIEPRNPLLVMIGVNAVAGFLANEITEGIKWAIDKIKEPEPPKEIHVHHHIHLDPPTFPKAPKFQDTPKLPEITLPIFPPVKETPKNYTETR